MAYSVLLKSAIEKSGYSNKEIADRCKEFGKSVDPSYISKLANGKIDPPSDEITITLSKVLEVSQEELLIEACLDKAPKSIVDFIRKIRLLLKAPSEDIVNHNDKTKLLEIIEQTINSKPFSDFILEFNESNTGSLEDMISSSSFNTLSSSKFATGIYIEDDSMQPLIPKGSEVIFNTNSTYENGDIIGVYDIENEKIIIRKYYKLPNFISELENVEYDIQADGKYFILAPINKNYESAVYHSFLVNDDLVTGIKNYRLILNPVLLSDIKANSLHSSTPQCISIIGKVEKVVTKV